MIQCDLCGQEKACRPREIEGKQYDICSACWKPWAQKLKGKGRAVRERETVFLPPPPLITTTPEPKEPMPSPAGPPKIWSGARVPQVTGRARA